MLFKGPPQSYQSTTVILTIISIAISIAIILSVENIKKQTKASFTVHSRVPTNCRRSFRAYQPVLYSVFRIGGTPIISVGRVANYCPTKELAGPSLFLSVTVIRAIVYWERHRITLPIIGTVKATLNLCPRKHSPMSMMWFGAEVAKQLGYKIDEKIIVSHGISEVSFLNTVTSPLPLLEY